MVAAIFDALRYRARSTHDRKFKSQRRNAPILMNGKCYVNVFHDVKNRESSGAEPEPKFNQKVYHECWIWVFVIGLFFKTVLLFIEAHVFTNRTGGQFPSSESIRATATIGLYNLWVAHKFVWLGQELNPLLRRACRHNMPTPLRCRQLLLTCFVVQSALGDDQTYSCYTCTSYSDTFYCAQNEFVAAGIQTVDGCACCTVRI